MKRFASFICLLAAAAMAVAQQPPQTAQAPTFRTSTRLVVQTVSVKDAEGRPVEGLTATDFVVTEDGEPQAISFVEFQRLTTTPVAAPAANAAPAADPAPAPRPSPATAVAPAADVGIATAPPGDLKYRDRRLLVLYFDLTALPGPDLLRAYKAANTFVASQMTPADLIAVMTFQGGAVRVQLDFTNDRARLREVFE